MAADNRKPVNTRRIPKPRSETSGATKSAEKPFGGYTVPEAQRAYVMREWLASVADACEAGSLPPTVARDLQRMWNVWRRMGSKDRQALLREHLYELCQECSHGLSEGYTADKAATLVIGAMRLYVNDAPTLALLRAQRARIAILVKAIAEGKSKAKDVTIVQATEALFGELGWDVNYLTFKRTRARRNR